MKNFFTFCLYSILSVTLIGCQTEVIEEPIVYHDQYGAIFPSATAINHKDQKFRLPKAFPSDYSLVILAFDAETQQKNILSWIQSEHDVIKILPDLQYHTFFILDKADALQTPHKHIEDGVTIYTNKQEFLNHMQMSDDKNYVLLLDKDAAIIWRNEEEATPQKLNDLKHLLRLLGDPLTNYTLSNP